MKISATALVVLAAAPWACVRADEGLWLFSAPPRAAVKAAYGFEMGDAWLDHLMKSSVRVGGDGSGAFVSADGLVITNYHIAIGALQKMGSATKDYIRGGFYARTEAEEARCIDLELDVLQSIEDVTGRVNAAVPAGASGDGAAAARRSVSAQIESESLARTGLQSEVVTLFQGGQYHLYRFKRYTDVRLVFSPEQQAALFGGDPDNFEFPRYDLDVCILRAYENGRPVHPGHYLKWSAAGARDGDLVFVSGDPSRTDRLYTMAQLDFIRDTSLPLILEWYRRREVLLSAWSGRSPENERRARDALFSIRNSRKLYDGMTAGLQDPQLMGAKEAAEASLRQALSGRADGRKALGAFAAIEAAEGSIARDYVRRVMLETAFGFMSESFPLARTLLRSGDERQKPNGERLPEFADQRRDSLEFGLFSERPLYADMDIVTLGDALTSLSDRLGYADPTVQAVLAGKSPRNRAAELILGTGVRDLAYRRRLYEGGSAAVSAAHDPLIEVARRIDGESRALRRAYEAQTEIIRRAQSAIGEAKYAVQGDSAYPDATQTPRLSFGRVSGYEASGAQVAPLTTIAGLYRRSEAGGGRPPYDLPHAWADRKGAVDGDAPYDFVSTCDLYAGSSGSPVVDRSGALVGVVFDGNVDSLTGDIAYSPRARAVAVHSAGILEALRKVYGAASLADELVSGHR